MRQIQAKAFVRKTPVSGRRAYARIGVFVIVLLMVVAMPARPSAVAGIFCPLPVAVRPGMAATGPMAVSATAAEILAKAGLVPEDRRQAGDRAGQVDALLRRAEEYQELGYQQ